jgi:diguanylate cyclase (GGDEF)-like protein/PAS domain S-box-containing protein
MPKENLWARLKQWVQQERRVLITASGVAGCVIILRMAGLLQLAEWAAVDQVFRLRPLEKIDERIVIVEINETDLKKIKKWPIPDGVMAELLNKLDTFKPRAIGLDIYRDLPVPPGHDEFVKASKSIPNVVGIELIKNTESIDVPPPPVLNELKQIGFNNVVIDADNKVRRSLLYWHVNGKTHTSLALKLASIYLKAEGITPKAARVNPKYLQLGKAVFRAFKPNDGAYVRADSSGYQVLANFRRNGGFRTVSLTDVLAGNVDANLIRDRIVLIGSTAPSLKDFFYTPSTSNLIQVVQPMSGVELHAHFVSQILSAALDGRPLINIWPELTEALWIWAWSWLGASLSWRCRFPRKSAFSILLVGTVLVIGSYAAFIFGWWIPLVPPTIALAGSGIAIMGYLAHLEEEGKRSKEFLQKVINTIADPIFVKDREHHWIILNRAYCKFIGYAYAELIDKSDYDVFPKHEADVFRQQNELVFRSGEEQENEEEFTDAWGNTHVIATKRSLHKDSAGNLFLVGVIRDMTERKRMEEDLKRTAEELIRSNTELKISEDRLRYLAYHDQLTGLPNRKHFHESIIQSIEWAASNKQLVALLFLDLDGFKDVNDTRGHDMGDLLLKVVAKRLTGCLRGSDTVSRLGGDEFTVILPGIPKPEDAAIVAEKIVRTLAKVFILEGHSIYISVSIGISIYPLDGENMDTLMKNADSAMYRAKQLGRNQFYHLHS